MSLSLEREKETTQTVQCHAPPTQDMSATGTVIRDMSVILWLCSFEKPLLPRVKKRQKRQTTKEWNVYHLVILVELNDDERTPISWTLTLLQYSCLTG